MGCPDLLIVIDHKPLVKILGDRRLDEIENPRLFCLKQCTLIWKFTIEYQPGVENHFADAMSRRPNEYTKTLSTAMMSDEDILEATMVAGIAKETEKFFAVTWERVREMSKCDDQILTLISHIEDGFPSCKDSLPEVTKCFWPYRDDLTVADGVVIYQDRIVIPSRLRGKILENLHSAHQGVSSMTSRALVTVFWPGITLDIQNSREECRPCHRNAPSQVKLPPVEPKLPKTPFEMIYADFFELHGKHYLVIGDRLSGWTEVVQVQPGSDSSGAKGLCKALRQIFATFGVPEEISSDGGPEFIALETQDFYTRWGTAHRLSSAYFPQSNGRAELAVKATKRLLVNNISPTGSLNTDKVVRALLQQRNTPDRDCKLSPAEVLFGRPLKDSLPQVDKSVMLFESKHIHPHWHQAWAAKESAIRSRLVKNCENLEAHTKELEPLREGDNVFVQNQNPAFGHPKKWDRQGKVVAIRNFDQYLIRISGSGRLTVRNRRFLRKFNERTPHVTDPPIIRDASRLIDRKVPELVRVPPSLRCNNDVEEPLTRNEVSQPENISDRMLLDAPLPPEDNPPLHGVPDLSTPVADSELVDNEQAVSVRRSTRTKVQRKMYDAASGTYK